MQEEIWVPILGYEQTHEISNFCRVRRKLKSKFRYLTARPHGNGYYSFSLSKDKKCKNKFAHRLLAIAFIPNPENKRCVNHIDGNKGNNSISNLEWCTHRENNVHALKSGLRTMLYFKGKKINIEIAKEIYSRRFECSVKLSKEYGINRSSIQGICCGRIWNLKKRGFVKNYPKITHEKLVDLFKSTGLSQKEFSEKIGVWEETLGSWIHKGFKFLHYSSQKKIIDAFPDEFDV